MFAQGVLNRNGFEVSRLSKTLVVGIKLHTQEPTTHTHTHTQPKHTHTTKAHAHAHTHTHFSWSVKEGKTW